MSPASKSKSKDKLAARAVKEQKASLKSTPAPANSGNGVPGSAYNPISGTFHALETGPSASLPPPPNNGRFRTIDETDNHSSSSLGTTAEYDSLSNNDSCSGESEDQKEKTTMNSAPRIESIPGSDTDKRDKIRQKNERKHQRQREKRAQELHERCSGYLMSRKLEMLAQKLVAMGFSLERATMALIFNEGRVEESVAWLFEGVEDSKNQTTTNLDGANLKIDIADELAQISTLEIKYKCTKQEVERVVVSCEGDLEKAEDALKAQKQEQSMAPPKPDQIGDHVASTSDFSNKLASSGQNPEGRTSVKGVASTGLQKQRRDERDFNYTKPVATVAQIESTNRNPQPLRKAPTTKQDVTRSQFATAPLDKRRPVPNPGPSVPYSPVSPLQIVVQQAKPESRYAIGGGHEVYTNGHTSSTLKEPIIVMQRPPSIPPKQSISTSISLSVSPPVYTGWYPNGTTNIDVMKMAAGNDGLGHQLRNLSLSGATSQQLYPQNQHQPFVSSPFDSASPGWGSSLSATGSSIRTSSSIAMPSSLGLFTGWGSLGSGSVDWSTGGSVPQCDYANVDWSLESTPLMSSALKSNRLYDSRSTTTFMGAKVSRPAMVDGGMCLGEVQDGSLVTDPTNSVGSQEWTSPFNGRDLFRAPRQFVTSPSP